MDHVGAIAGPLLASLFLLLAPGHYRLLFALTIVPGAAAVWMLTRIPEERAGSARSGRASARDGRTAGGARKPSSMMPTPLSWRLLPRQYYVVLAVLLVFTLGNSADAFLLLRLSDAGVAPALIPLLWAALHVVKAGMSVWGGVKSDRWGRRRVIGAGWLVYAIVYAGFASSQSVPALIGWFLLYGLYFGLSEGAEKALIADLTPSSLSGSAFGLYNAALGIGALLASVAFGLVWKIVSPAAAFALGAALALLATALLLALVREPRAVDAGAGL
jgi:MFS family permease